MSLFDSIKKHYNHGLFGFPGAHATPNSPPIALLVGAVSKGKDMKDKTIELPPLPEAVIVSYQTDSTMRRMELRTYSDEDMRDYARAALVADRKRRGSIVNNASASSEPVGVAGTMPGTSGFTMACFPSDKVPVGTSLYLAPQPLSESDVPAEPVKCPICYEDEPHTGTCGSSDPKALCNRAEPVSVRAAPQPAEPVKPLSDLIVTKGGIPFEDQNEGIRQFKEACMAAADHKAKVASSMQPLEPVKVPNDELVANIKKALVARALDCQDDAELMADAKCIADHVIAILAHYGQPAQPIEPVKVPSAVDAQRYRWIRSNWGRIVDTYEGDSGRVVQITVTDSDTEGWDTDPASLDAAIDKAIGVEPPRHD